LEHKGPILVDEFYAIKLTVVNQEENAIENVNLSVELQQQPGTNEVENTQSIIDLKTCIK
jgi:hypothetical protein